MAPFCSAGAAGAGRQSHQGPFIHPFHDHDDMSLYILSMLLKLSKLLCYSRIAKTSKVCTIFERQPSLLQPSKAEYQVVKAITLFSETYVLCKPCTQGDLTQIFPTFSNQILNLNFYINADPKSTYVSNIQQNSAELCTNVRFCHQAPTY